MLHCTTDCRTTHKLAWCPTRIQLYSIEGISACNTPIAPRGKTEGYSCESTLSMYRKRLINYILQNSNRQQLLKNANDLLTCWKPTCVGCNKNKTRTKCLLHNTGKHGREKNQNHHVRSENDVVLFDVVIDFFVTTAPQRKLDIEAISHGREKERIQKSYARLAYLAWVLTCSIMAASYSPLESYICSANVESRGSSWSG